MKTIQTTIVVDAEHRATIQLPADISPGEHIISLIFAEKPPMQPLTMEGFPIHDVGPWPENLSLRREDMYGDDGR